MKMGILNFLQENNPFLNSREGDFIPLNNPNNDDDNDDSIGPPLLILYAAPGTIGIEEYCDMVCDGMPNRRVVDVVENSDKEDDNEKKQVIVIRRLEGMNEGDDNNNNNDAVLDLTVKDALDTLASSSSSFAAPTITTSTTVNKNVAASSPVAQQKNEEMENNNNNNTPCPVLYFSGVTNTEMMTTYRIIANEIYQETNGVHWPACAKVVTPALVKSLRQVLGEISGDHADAMRLQRDDEE